MGIYRTMDGVAWAPCWISPSMARVGSPRCSGLGRLLHETFFQAADARGYVLVRAVTSPVNPGSVAFHQRISFQLEPGDAEVDGIRFPPAMTATAATGFASSGACAVLGLLTPPRPGDNYRGQVIAPRTFIPAREERQVIP
jgi:hypothetical protein